MSAAGCWGFNFEYKMKRIPSNKPPRCRCTKLKPRLIYWFLAGALLLIMLILGLVLGVLLGLARKSRADDIDLVVDLGYVKYKGAREDGGISHWWGMRYADPPTGNFRFRGPQWPQNDTTGSVRDADKHAPACYPTSSGSEKSPETGMYDEDCLFLDVYAPTSSSDARPVFVWFPGGGFNLLADTNRDGSPLIKAADNDMVVVTVNYRVGLWGFLASKEVGDDGDFNVGLRDQRAALHWVQNHIHLFGGNASHVTIGGASAGGASVDLQLSAYGGRDDGLFHAAAAESQSFGAQLTVDESQYQYNALKERVGCNVTDSLTCLRGKDVSILYSNSAKLPTPGGGGGMPNYMWSNVIDGNFTTDYTYKLYAEGKFVKVPVIFGDDTDEGTMFTPNNLIDTDDMYSFLKNNYAKLTQDQFSQIKPVYQKGKQYDEKGEYWSASAAAYGEIRYICPGINLSSVIPQHGVPQSWNYHWDYLTAENEKSGLGVPHTMEADYIWGAATSDVQPLIQGYWTSFIRSFDPNTYRAKNAPEWKTFDGEAMQRMHFPNSVSGVGMESVTDEQKKRCEYLSGIGVDLQQ